MTELSHVLLPMRTVRHAVKKLQTAGFDRLAAELEAAVEATRERLRDTLSEAICQSIAAGAVTRHQILHDPLVVGEATKLLKANQPPGMARTLTIHRLHLLVVNKRVTYSRSGGVKHFALNTNPPNRKDKP